MDRRPTATAQQTLIVVAALGAAIASHGPAKAQILLKATGYERTPDGIRIDRPPSDARAAGFAELGRWLAGAADTLQGVAVNVAVFAFLPAIVAAAALMLAWPRAGRALLIAVVLTALFVATAAPVIN